MNEPTKLPQPDLSFAPCGPIKVSSDDNPPNPQPGEVWLHNTAGPVRILSRWNKKECVCEDERKRRRLLSDALMIGQIVNSGNPSPAE